MAMPRWRRLLLIALAALLALASVGYWALTAATARSQLARAVIWGESDVHDYARFPARRITAGPTPFRFHRPPTSGGVAPVRTIGVLEGGRRVERDLEQFLAASDTTAFLIVRGDTLLYERYFNGYGHDSVQTSMSMAKSVLSALVGIAIGEGRIGSVEDPITRYVPELAARDSRFCQVTLRHLLTMTSGLRYEESGGPWGDDTATYYAPDLRKLALRDTQVVEEPGRFHYNNFNPLLVGLALERAVGMPVATYLERRLWQPLGMEADGSWSLDSQASGFEKMESGLNGRAVDFAKFGLLFAKDGRWRDRQLVPRAWVRDPTLVPTRVAAAPAPSYQFFWWMQDDRRPRAQFARGKYGQHLYVVPESKLVLVRFGRDSGYPHWPELLSDLARRLDQNATDQFDTWAYAWSLVFLVGAGLGRWLTGAVRGRHDLATSGRGLISLGLVAFVGLAVFFELVVGIGGKGRSAGAAGRYAVAVVLILGGLALLGRRLLGNRQP